MFKHSNAFIFHVIHRKFEEDNLAMMDITITIYRWKYMILMLRLHFITNP